MEQFKDGSGDLIEADLDFHMGILRATEQSVPQPRSAASSTPRCNASSASAGRAPRASRISRLKQHGVILKAIRAGAAARARKRMAELLEDLLADVAAFSAAHGK